MARVLFGFPIYSDAGVTYTPTFSGGSWESALPLTNLADRRLAKVARATDDALTSTIIKADLKTARTVRLVGLPKHNLSTAAKWRVRGLGAEPIFEDNDFNAWTDVGTPVITTGQTDPFGGTRSTLIEDNDGALAERKQISVSFTGNGVKAIGITLKAGTAGISGFGIYDNSASTWRHLVQVTWSGGVPTLSSNLGSGTLYTPVALGGGEYELTALVDAVVAANTNQFHLFPADPNLSSATGTVTAYEALAWDLTTQPIPYDSGVVDAWPTGIDAEESEGMNVGTVLTFAAATAQYWRIELADTANADGYVELGRLIIAAGWQPTINMAVGAKLGLETETGRQVTDGGAAVYTDRPRRRTFTCVMNDLPETEALENGFDMQRIAGLDGQLYFVYDPDDTTHLHRRSFLAVFRQLSAIESTILARSGVPLALVEEL